MSPNKYLYAFLVSALFWNCETENDRRERERVEKNRKLN
jgi:hypothetical protein